MNKLFFALTLITIVQVGTAQVYVPGTHNQWALDESSEAILKEGLGLTDYYGYSFQAIANQEFKIAYQNWNTNWGGGYWITMYDKAWEIAPGGENAIWKGAPLSWLHLCIKNPADAVNSNIQVGIMTLSAQPVDIETVSQVGTLLNGNYVAPTGNQTVEISINTPKSPEEKIYLRYTTNQWQTSSFVLATGENTTYQASINIAETGTTVQYYVFTTTLDWQAGNDLDSDPDLMTINYNINNGNLWSYTVENYDNNALLSEITINGNPFEAFAPETFNYQFQLPDGTTQIPVVEAQPQLTESVVEIFQATNLLGSETERTATILVTAPDEITTDVYSILFILNTASDDSNLSSIFIDNEQLTGFDPYVYEYFVQIESNIGNIPQVSAIANNSLAQIVVYQATNIQGSENERTARILVTAPDEIHTSTYLVVFQPITQTGELQLFINMNYFIYSGHFFPETETIDVVGTFNNWGETPLFLEDSDNDGIFSTQISAPMNQEIEFVCRINEDWARAEFVGTNELHTVFIDNEIVEAEFWFANIEMPTGIEAALATISLDGNLLADFSPNTTTYIVEIQQNMPLPTVSATAIDELAEIVITQAENIFGTLPQRTAEIFVSSANGQNHKYYQVIFFIGSELQFISAEINPENYSEIIAEFSSEIIVNQGFSILINNSEIEIENIVGEGTKTLTFSINSSIANQQEIVLNYNANTGDAHNTEGALLQTFSYTLQNIVPGQAPNSPENLVATAVSNKRIDLQWNDNSNNETGFTIERKTATTEWQIISTIYKNTDYFADFIEIAAGTEYFYRIKSFNNSGASEYSNEANAISFASNIVENQYFNVIIYPNPADNFIYVSINSNENINKIQINNVEGKLMQTVKNFKPKKIEIDISEFPAGLYFVEIETTTNQRYVYKVLKK